MSFDEEEWNDLVLPELSGEEGDFEFEKWSIVTEILLEGEGVAGAIFTDLSVSKDATEKKANVEARLILLSHTRGKMFNKIKGLVSAKKMWDEIQNHYGNVPEDEESIYQTKEEGSKAKSTDCKDLEIVDSFVIEAASGSSEVKSTDYKHTKTVREYKDALIFV